VDSAITKYGLNKIANSESVRQLNRKAYDPNDLELMRNIAGLGRDAANNPLGQGQIDTLAKDLKLWGGGGGVTDQITSMFTQASELTRGAPGAGQVAQELRKNQLPMATKLKEMATNLTQALTARGIRGVNGSATALAKDGLGELMTGHGTRDPVGFLGIEELGVRPEGLTFGQVDELRTRTLQSEIADATDQLLKPIKDTKFETAQQIAERLQNQIDENTFRLSHTPFAILEAGEKVPLSYAKIAEGHTHITPVLESQPQLGLQNFKIAWGPNRSQRLWVDQDGKLFMPNKKKQWADLTHSEQLHAFAAGRARAQYAVNQQTPFLVQPDADWFALDIAQRIANDPKGGKHLVQFATPGQTLDDLGLMSFAKKVEDIRQNQPDLNKLAPDEVFAIRVAYNLPRTDSHTAALMQNATDPLDQLLMGFQNGADVMAKGYRDVIGAYNTFRHIQGFTEDTADSLKSLLGNSFDFMRNDKGDFLPPVVGYSRPLNPYEWSRDHLMVRQAANAERLKTVLDSGTGPLTAELHRILTQSPEYTMARDVLGLADDQSRSFIPGFRNSAPQTFEGGLINAVTARDRRDVDNLPMLAASQLQNSKVRFLQGQFKKITEHVFGDTISQINSPANAQSLMLLNQFFAHGRGWDLGEALIPVKLPNGKTGWGFQINTGSKGNEDRALSQFGLTLKDKQKGADLLLAPNGKPVVLDDLAKDTLERFTKFTEFMRAEKNTLLRSQGLKQINQTPWYIPPPDLNGKYLAFTFDQNGDMVKGLTLIGDSPKHLGELREAAQSSPMWRQGFTTRTKDEVTDFMSLWDKAQMDWMDPFVTPVQSAGKANTGGLAGPSASPKEFSKNLVRLMDMFMTHGDDVVDVLMDTPIKAAKVRANVSRLETAVGGKTVSHSSQFDRYLQNLQGKNSLTSKDSFLGDFQSFMENRINGALNSNLGPKALADRVAGLYQDFMKGAYPGRTPKGDTFEKFSKALGKFMPFSNPDEFSQYLKYETPADVKQLASKLNWFEASHRLRWGETMHAVVNMTSIVANTPSVIRSLQPMAGETFAEAAARNSNVAMAMTLPNGQQIMTLHPGKMLWKSMMHAFGWGKSKPSQLIQDAHALALGEGRMSQEVDLLTKSFAAIEDRHGWKAWMVGNPAHQGDTVADKIKRNGGLDGMISMLTDKSESWSRQWAMHAGFLAGEAAGITNPQQLVSFAQDISNKTIANYDPLNRPEIFQGALGSVAGLFQSYMLNFYGRMTRYIETKNTRALANQAIMQGAIFGVDSLPGWDTLNSYFFDRGDALGDDPVESMYARFGQTATDLFLHGTLANLPKLFGADGTSIYTRADVSPRLPGSQWTMLADTVPVPNLPAVDTMTKIWHGVTKGIALSKVDGVGTQEWAELASNVIVNRPLAGIVEQMGAGGYDTDFDGQVISRTQTASEAIYRTLGLRSMTQQKAIEHFYANKTAQEEQLARRDVLTTSTRAAIRDKRFDDVPGLFAQYVEQGGDPSRYSSWINSSIKYALLTRGERQLQTALKDPTNRHNAIINRLIDAKVGVREGEVGVEDYGRADADAQIREFDWTGNYAPKHTVGQGTDESPSPLLESPSDDLDPIAEEVGTNPF